MRFTLSHSTACRSHSLADENPDGGKSLTVYLTKENGMDWWSRVAENEPEIDVTKVRHGQVVQ